jgi:hypothetical protein
VTDQPAQNPSAPTRSDLGLEIDRAWRIAKNACDPEAATRHWARHNELVKQRAAQQQQRAG